MTSVVVDSICQNDIQHQQLQLQLQLKPHPQEQQQQQQQQDAGNNNNNNYYCWQYCPKKQAQLRDEALAKILLRGNKAGYADYLRLGQEVLARDSKKTGYFPARLVVKDTPKKKVPKKHIRIHYDGRPEGEYRDIPESYVYYLPQENDDDNDNDNDDRSLNNNNNNNHILLLSPWVLLDEMHNFEMTPLLAYSKVFERTEFRKLRAIYDGTVFEVMDKLGRIVKVKSEWIYQHSTAHPDAIQEALQEAATAPTQQQQEENKKEQFFDLIYGASHKKSNSNNNSSSTATGGGSYAKSSLFAAATTATPPPPPMLMVEKPSASVLSSSVLPPRIQYGNEIGQSFWLPAAFASAVHVYATADQGNPHRQHHKRDRDRNQRLSLQECARTIYQRGKLLRVDCKLRHNFVDMVNRIVNPIGYRMEALQFFNLLHTCPQAGSAPVVACIFPQQQQQVSHGHHHNVGGGGGGFGKGKCVSFYKSWVLDPSEQYATNRTVEGLTKLYGKECNNYNSHGIVSWSYCLVPFRTQLLRRQRSSSSSSSSNMSMSNHQNNNNPHRQNKHNHHHHRHRHPISHHHHHQQQEQGDDDVIAINSHNDNNNNQGLFKKKCRSRKRSRGVGGRNRNSAAAAASNLPPAKRAR